MRLIALALFGCAEDAEKTPDSGAPDGVTGNDSDDSGDTDDSTVDTGPAGCIHVDGAGDYPDIASAVAAAAEGATVFVCAGEYAESVTVDKAISLSGDAAVLVPPSNTPGFDLSGAVSVIGFTIRSTRSGVMVTGDGAQVSGLVIEAPGNWGVEATGATGLVVDGLTITGAAFGGVSVSDGDAIVRGCAISDVSSYGVLAHGAALEVSGNSVTQVTALGDTDGIAIYSVDGLLTSAANSITGATVGILSDGAGLSSAADQVTDVSFGIYAYGGTISVTDAVVSDVYALGIYAVSADGSVLLENSSTTTDFETSYDNPYADLWENSLSGGGIVVAGTSNTVRGVSISGFRTFGAFFGTPTGDEVPTDASALTISGVGRYGIYSSGAATTLTDSMITGLVEPEYGAPCRDDIYTSSYYPYASAAVFNAGTTMVVDNTTFSSNSGWGIANYQGQLTVSGATFQDHACAAIISFYGTADVSTSSFAGPALPAAVWDYYGVTTVADSLFTAGTGTVYYAYESGGSDYVTVYDGQGKGVYGQGSAELEVQGSSFADGDYGVYAVNAPAIVTGNSFTGMNRSSVTAGADDTSVEILVQDNNFSDVGDYVIELSTVHGEVLDNVVDSQRATTTNYEYYLDGALYSTSTSSFNGDVVLASAADLDLAGLVLGDVVSDAIYLSESTGSIEDVTVTSTVGNLIEAYWETSEPDLEVSSLGVGYAGAYGVLLVNTGSVGGYVRMEGLTVEASDYNGVHIEGFGEAELDGVTVTNAGYYGIYADEVVTLSLRDTTIDAATYDGISLIDVGATMTGVVVTGSGDNGLQLEGGSVDVQGNQLTGNDTYGMSCDEVTLVACTGNDLSGNGTGEHSGCDDACGE